MTPTQPFPAVRRAFGRALGLILLLGAGLAQAQFVWVAPNGTRHYSDQPPPPGTPPSRILKAPGLPAVSLQLASAPAAKAAPETSAAAPAAVPVQPAEKPKGPPTLAEREADFRAASRWDEVPALVVELLFCGPQLLDDLQPLGRHVITIIVLTQFDAKHLDFLPMPAGDNVQRESPVGDVVDHRGLFGRHDAHLEQVGEGLERATARDDEVLTHASREVLGGGLVVAGRPRGGTSHAVQAVTSKRTTHSLTDFALGVTQSRKRYA